MIRSFIAMEIPPECQEAIVRSTRDLQQALPHPLVRWIPARNIHLTMQFLGDVSAGKLESLAKALESVAGTHTGIPVTISGLGAFPSQRRARILWVGLIAPAALAVLYQEIITVTARLGFPPENRPFSPHITIGRVNAQASPADLKKIEEQLDIIKPGDVYSFEMNAIHIHKSTLSATGAEYSRLYSMPFKPVQSI